MISLRFVCGAGLSSRAIAWFSAGHLSHVDAVLPNGDLLGARYDNVGGGTGVRARPPGYEKVARVLVMQIPATPQQESDWLTFLRAQNGKPYDSLAIWAFVINRSWRATDSWICSELQAAALEACGIVHPGFYLQSNKITPVALALAVSAIPGTTWREQ
jgi:uncharacterized protein YycO